MHFVKIPVWQANPEALQLCFENRFLKLNRRVYLVGVSPPRVISRQGGREFA